VEQPELKRHILYYNQESFRAAASSSPCSHGVIHHDKLSFTSLSPASGEQLLRGKIHPEGNVKDIQLRAFLASFAIPEHLRNQPPISATIIADDVKHCFEAWKEAHQLLPLADIWGITRLLLGTLFFFNASFIL
jgi:hypothetical protein